MPLHCSLVRTKRLNVERSGIAECSQAVVKRLGLVFEDLKIIANKLCERRIFAGRGTTKILAHELDRLGMA